MNQSDVRFLLVLLGLVALSIGLAFGFYVGVLVSWR